MHAVPDGCKEALLPGMQEVEEQGGLKGGGLEGLEGIGGVGGGVEEENNETCGNCWFWKDHILLSFKKTLIGQKFFFL